MLEIRRIEFLCSDQLTKRRLGTHREETMRSLSSLVLAALFTTLVTPAVHAEPVKIRIGWNVVPSNMASIAWVEPKTVGLKYYGVTYIVEPMRFPGGGTQLSALASGQLDVGMGSPTLFVQGVKNAGLNMRLIANVLNDPCDGQTYSQAFWVANDSGLKSVADLKGKTIAISAIGSGNDTSLNMALAKAKLTAKDVTKIEVGVGAVPGFLKEKKVDTGFLLPQFETEMEKAGFHRLFKQCDALGPVEMISHFATAEYIAKNRAALVDMMADLMLATRWFYDPKNRSEALRIASVASKQPVASFEPWMFTKKDYGRDMNLVPDVRGFQASIDQAVQFGLLKAGLSVDPGYLDLSLIQDARKKLDGPAN